MVTARMETEILLLLRTRLRWLLCRTAPSEMAESKMVETAAGVEADKLLLRMGLRVRLRMRLRCCDEAEML